ncbi:putative heavy metal ion homeostasis protein [Phyllosticta capitalensis]|uniref:Heavy metal ion homeostasis protein n=1 Tax=Phyllosticta capitalensis TaxID=121624 RepID=A0ABR1YYT7_9PEZI
MPRYQRLSANDEDDHVENTPAAASLTQHYPIPSSPPPSFHSRSSSPRPKALTTADRELEDTFASPSDDEDSDDDHDGPDDRQRLMRGQPEASRDHSADSGESSSQRRTATPPRPIERRVTQLPAFGPGANANGRVVGGGVGNDGVFANLSAKPTRGEEVEEKPPSYEQAAADATPPYWETTILAPGLHTDEVFVDGLPVGSVFSFIWNAIISMAFQLVGFLLTYLLHTTHAAKNGARAGLGITLVQYGFTMKGAATSGADVVGGGSTSSPNAFNEPPKDPNNVDFDPDDVTGGGDGVGGAGGISTSEWLAYILMIVGWFILIRSVSDFLRARRHEQIVLQSSNRGLNVPVVADGESPGTAV